MAWLHTEVVYPPEDGHPSSTNLSHRNFVDTANDGPNHQLVCNYRNCLDVPSIQYTVSLQVMASSISWMYIAVYLYIYYAPAYSGGLSDPSICLSHAPNSTTVHFRGIVAIEH